MPTESWIGDDRAAAVPLPEGLGDGRGVAVGADPAGGGCRAGDCCDGEEAGGGCSTGDPAADADGEAWA